VGWDVCLPLRFFLSVMFSTDLPFLSTTTAFAAGGPSSSYRYLKGIRTVNYEKSFDDAARANTVFDTDT